VRKLLQRAAQRIEHKKLGQLTLYSQSPRHHSDAQITGSIAQFGFKSPIQNDSRGNIIAGNSRYLAALQLGLETVPVIVLDHLNEIEQRAYRLAKLGELSEPLQRASMVRPRRFSQLSTSRKALVRLFQSINYGHIRDLRVHDREPFLANPSPVVLVDLKLDAEEHPRDELAADDFELCAEVERLMSVLDRLPHGKISIIDVRAGIPRRIVIEKLLTEGGELMER
jgi:hypothetical protein